MDVTLYQAANDLRDLLDQVDPETGEIVEGVDSARDIVARKATSVAAYILDTDKQAAMVKAAGEELIARAWLQEKRNKRLREYLLFHMVELGMHEIKDKAGLFSAKVDLGRDASVDVFDEKQLPTDYLTVVPETATPDKKKLLSELKEGVDIPGARLVRRDRLTLK